jgi:hypothetical protein
MRTAAAASSCSRCADTLALNPNPTPAIVSCMMEGARLRPLRALTSLLLLPPLLLLLAAVACACR